MRLSGVHESRVTALRLCSAGGETLLFTASCNCVARWLIDDGEGISEVRASRPVSKGSSSVVNLPEVRVRPGVLAAGDCAGGDCGQV